MLTIIIVLKLGLIFSYIFYNLSMVNLFYLYNKGAKSLRENNISLIK